MDILVRHFGLVVPRLNAVHRKLDDLKDVTVADCAFIGDTRCIVLFFIEYVWLRCNLRASFFFVSSFLFLMPLATVPFVLCAGSSLGRAYG